MFSQIKNEKAKVATTNVISFPQRVSRQRMFSCEKTMRTKSNNLKDRKHIPELHNELRNIYMHRISLEISVLSRDYEQICLRDK